MESKVNNGDNNYILDVRVDNLEKNEIFGKINDFLTGNKFCQIATINPEFILEAHQDAEFKEILNRCDLNIADGIGIKLAFWRKGKKLKCRLTGADLMNEILKMGSEKGLKVFLVANKDGLSSWEETANAINKTYPDLTIGGTNINKNEKYQVPDDKYQILFCNFGAPYQEKFLYSLKQENYGKIKLAMGVGGSFDFWTRKLHRAPKLMQNLGLEWLFRLIQQPKRFRRIFRAVIVFPIRVISNK